MAKKAKVNYSAEDILTLEEGYNPEADQDTRTLQVKALADALGRNNASIVAKLVNLGVYVKKAHVAKDGSPIVAKGERVNQLAEKMGILPELFDSLAKANVSVIKALDEQIERGNRDSHNLAMVLDSIEKEFLPE